MVLHVEYSFQFNSHRNTRPVGPVVSVATTDSAEQPGASSNPGRVNLTLVK